MVISFFGHGRYTYGEKEKEKLYSVVKGIAEGQVVFYIGGYGNFDRIAYDCAERYKKEVDGTAKIVFVTPYIDEIYLKNKTEFWDFDEVLYPPLETAPKRLSILKRNEYVVEKSDYIVFYVDHNFGGASQALEFAKRKNKRIFNISADKNDG